MGAFNSEVGQGISQGTVGLSGMVDAGMQGNAQDVFNAGFNSAGTIASGYDAQTGATI